MEYTGNYKEKHTKEYGRVFILEYVSKKSIPMEFCTCCGKPLIRKMFVVQDAETDLEVAYLGADCVRNLK